MPRHLNRRQFVGRTAAGAAAAGGLFIKPAWAGSPNEKLDIAVIGTTGRGAANLNGVGGENIVGLCDVDTDRLQKAADEFPRAKTFTDFRKMLDVLGKKIDAVVVSTPDHTHAPAGAMALRMGKHCYCEKPLTHCVHETRVMTGLAKRNNLSTQMGTQIHAEDNYRRVVELVQAGVIGPVDEVHVWCPASYHGGDRPKETPPVPENLDWDLWLGPAPYRPYHPVYLPKTWRGWADFGNGGLGDFFCHYVDLPFWALGLRYPLTVEAEGPPVHPESTPPWLIVRYEFPARRKKPPVKLTWYDGGKRPPLVERGEVPDWRKGVLFVGKKGMLLADYRQHALLPESKFVDFEPPEPTIPDSIGHHLEWIEACKTGSPTTCNFGYSGPLAEAALLGTVSYRTGQKIEWDAKNLKAANCPEAEPYLRREYRKGWTL